MSSRPRASRSSRFPRSSTSSDCGSRTSGSAAAHAVATCASTGTSPAGSAPWQATTSATVRCFGAASAAGPGKPLVLVHGDTMTTVLGALLGRSLRVAVAHIEGGLRSYDLRHPFPEELNRRVASRLSRIDYAPGPWAASNLHGDVVDTGTNTIRDSLDLVPPGEPPFALPDEPVRDRLAPSVRAAQQQAVARRDDRGSGGSSAPHAAALHRPSGDGRHARALRSRSPFRRYELQEDPQASLLRLRARRAQVLVSRHGQRRQPGGVVLPRSSLSRAPSSHRAARGARRERAAVGHEHRRRCATFSPIRVVIAGARRSRPRRRRS